MTDHLACPTCGKPVAAPRELRPVSFPFCSSSCRYRDFGRWIDGSFVIAGEPLSIGEDADIQREQDIP